MTSLHLMAADRGQTGFHMFSTMRSLALVAMIVPCVACGHSVTTHMLAQEPANSPEIQKLAYYVGHWRGVGEAKASPFGPAGKLSSESFCEWFTGGFQLVCHGSETGPTGTRTFLNVRAYDAKAKAYTEYGISSLGDSEYDTGGTFIGNERRFTVESDADGKHLQVRYVEVQVSPTLFTYRAEASIDHGPWTLIGEGKVTKID